MKLTKARLEKLKAQTFTQATIEDLGLSADKLSDQAKAILTEYLKPFVKRDGNTCFCCEDRMGFVWGLAHGEGFCLCGYPSRAYHFIDLQDGNGEQRFARVLQYHPDGITMK